MERTHLFDLMDELKLYGMKAAFEEMATTIKRQHEPQRIFGDLLNAEINEKQARSIKYQLTIAKLALTKDLAYFHFDGTPINRTLVNELTGGGFIAQQRNAILVEQRASTIASRFTEQRTDPLPASQPPSPHSIRSKETSATNLPHSFKRTQLTLSRN
jgi:hypothetical protein